MLYGVPKAKVESDETDELGVRRVVIALKWVPSRAGMSQREIRTERPGAPEIGLPVMRTATTPGSSYFITRWTYEGTDQEGDTEFPPRTRETSDLYRFEPEWADLDITRHPKWAQWRAEFGGRLDGETGRVVWPETHEAPGQSVRGMSRVDGQMKPNPMFGRQTFQHLTGGSYIFEYVEEKFPRKFWERVGDIFKSSELPGEPPRLPGRDWLKTTPRYQRRGNLIAFTEVYKLSDIGGWPTQIYPVPAT